MDLRQLIKNYKQKTHLNNSQIAEQFGVNYTTVGRWLNGSVRSIQEDTAEKMSEILGFNVRAVLADQVVSVNKPILGIAKAGYDLFLEENYLGEEEITFSDYDKGDFFLKVVGNSMKDAGIIDGGLVYVKQCNIVKNGDIAVISIGDEVTIKKFKANDQGITLIACNPDIDDRSFTNQEVNELPVSILGKVVYAKNYF